MFRKFDKRDYLGVFQNGGESKNKTPYATPTRRKDHDSSFDFEKSKQFAKDINEARWRFERFHNNRQSMLGKKEYNPNDYRSNYAEFSKHRDDVSRNIEDASLFYSGDGRKVAPMLVEDDNGNVFEVLHGSNKTLPIHFRNIPPYISLVDEESRKVGSNNRDVLNHEFGHFLYFYEPDDNGYSQSIVDKYMIPKSELNNHDRNIQEKKSDINSIRAKAYEQNLFDVKTGKYKSETGKFDSDMTENIYNKLRNSFPVRRLEYIFDGNKEGILEMINTFTNNNQRHYDKRNYQV